MKLKILVRSPGRDFELACVTTAKMAPALAWGLAQARGEFGRWVRIELSAYVSAGGFFPSPQFGSDFRQYEADFEKALERLKAAKASATARTRWFQAHKGEDGKLGALLLSNEEMRVAYSQNDFATCEKILAVA